MGATASEHRRRWRLVAEFLGLGLAAPGSSRRLGKPLTRTWVFHQKELGTSPIVFVPGHSYFVIGQASSAMDFLAWIAMNSNHYHLFEALSHSRLYQDYERAFREAARLPLSLRPVESWQLPHHGRRGENPFCAVMVQTSRACSACLQVHQKLAERSRQQPCTLRCPHGLCETAVPVRTGEHLIGFLQTGQVFRKRPTPAQFDHAATLLADWGVRMGRQQLQDSYFRTPVVSPAWYDSAVQLLSVFAQHLSAVGNQLLVQQQNAEPPMIKRAKEFILERQTDNLRLGQVARAVNASPFYFCKMFKKITGLNFTDYLARVRIEKAKNLLLNQNLRVSEIAYAVGFQSLTHFNRVFKRIVGESPTAYRSQVNS
jgi:AraC-like DNA-binding protein